MPVSASTKSSALKPRRALQAFCVACQGGAAAYVASCPDKDCQLHALRLAPENPQGPANAQGVLLEGRAAAGQAVTVQAPGEDQAPEATRAPGEIQVPGGMQAPEATQVPGATQAPHATQAGEAQPSAAPGKILPADSLACLRAIRRHCMVCADGRQDVRACADKNCLLWSYRFGVTPETYRRVKDRFFKPKKLLLPGLVQKTEAR